MRQQPQQPLPYPRLRRFFKTKLGIGCLGSVIVFFVVVAYAASTGGASTSNTPAPTSTQSIAVATATLPPTHLATSPTPHPTATLQPAIPTHIPAPTPTPCVSPCNPFGYNFISGNRIYNPASDFCSYFTCINNFSNGRGYVVECHDGEYSKSGGIQQVCSSHGGQWRILYSH